MKIRTSSFRVIEIYELWIIYRSMIMNLENNMWQGSSNADQQTKKNVKTNNITHSSFVNLSFI